MQPCTWWCTCCLSTRRFNHVHIEVSRHGRVISKENYDWRSHIHIHKTMYFSWRSLCRRLHTMAWCHTANAILFECSTFHTRSVLLTHFLACQWCQCLPKFSKVELCMKSAYSVTFHFLKKLWQFHWKLIDFGPGVCCYCFDWALRLFAVFFDTVSLTNSSQYLSI